MKNDRYIAFDIETTPIPFHTLDEARQEYLMRGAENEEERQRRMDEMALSPLTSRVVCIGLQKVEFNEEERDWVITSKAAFSLNSNDHEQIEIDNGILNEKPVYESIQLSTGDNCFLSSERDILLSFWQILEKYQNPCLISFNGRNFDAPFLMMRSAALKLRPSINLMTGTKFNYPNHFDLLDELTFYNPQKSGATRRYNFDFYTRAFGITSPKAEGVSGANVSELFMEGKIAEISEYCLRDVTATWELFKVWDQFLRFK